ncbi:MAG: hypothetical protein PUI23_06570, partial [Bacteroidales bacterium]|nr:hypothetical protein [Bacteroidales bacterium]MDY5226519.1 hypothetical protein [Sodaliphilus sp.]
WSKVECFAFGGATVRFASLETSFHAANHTIPPPLSYEGYPHCPKDKNRSPFHGEKPLIKKLFLGWWLCQFSPNDFAWSGRYTSRPRQMVDIQCDIAIMGGREVSRPYRVLFFAEGERFLSFWRCHRPRWRGRR